MYVCVCELLVCLSVCPRGYLQNHTRDLYEIFLCMLPMAVARSSSGVVAIAYVMYFRFCGWHHVFFYNGPYSSMNFVTKDLFRLNLLIYRKVGQNLVFYY